MDDRLRASNADRDRAAALLRAHFVAGRLTFGELDDRLAATLGAATFGDLRRALTGLPGSAPILAHHGQLECGYRRLLSLYPARYRRVHEEEILAVLMTAAAEGQDRPRPAEAADLILGALRVRCQTVRGRVSGWRCALALIGAGTVLGLLAGIPFASASPPMQTVYVAVRLAAPESSATAHAQQAIASSYPVLARAAPTIAPAMSERALLSHLQVSVVNGGAMDIYVEASNGAQAERAAFAVVHSYIAYVSNKNGSGGAGRLHVDKLQRIGPIARVRAPTVLYESWVSFVSRSTDVLETGALGALCGAVISAFGAGP